MSADLKPPAYRIGGARERVIWTGEQLVWVTEYPRGQPATAPDEDLPELPDVRAYLNRGEL